MMHLSSQDPFNLDPISGQKSHFSKLTPGLGNPIQIGQPVHYYGNQQSE
jgi:hypothetical protein